MVTYDTLYECPVCFAKHGAKEWNEATEEDFGAGIMPIGLADSFEYRYTCPTCMSEINKEDL